MTIDTKQSREKMAKRTFEKLEYNSVGFLKIGDTYFGTITHGHLIPEIDANGEAICHAVNIHDALCDEIDRLRATNAELRKLVTIQCDHPGCGVLHKASNPCPMGHKP